MSTTQKLHYGSHNSDSTNELLDRANYFRSMASWAETDKEREHYNVEADYYTQMAAL